MAVREVRRRKEMRGDEMEGRANEIRGEEKEKESAKVK